MNKPIWHESGVTRSQRWNKHGLAGATVWLTGLSGSGKSTIAIELARELLNTSRLAYILDADNLRLGLNSDLGYSDPDRTENIRRVAEVACLFADSGTVAIVPIISPFIASREHARKLHTEKICNSLKCTLPRLSTSANDAIQKVYMPRCAAVK